MVLFLFEVGNLRGRDSKVNHNICFSLNRFTQTTSCNMPQLTTQILATLSISPNSSNSCQSAFEICTRAYFSFECTGMVYVLLLKTSGEGETEEMRKYMSESARDLKDCD